MRQAGASGRAHVMGFFGARRGVIAIITAFLAPVIFGSAAMTVDVSYWLEQRAAAQTAADAAAYAAIRASQDSAYTSDSSSQLLTQMNASGRAAADLATNGVYDFTAGTAASLAVNYIASGSLYDHSIPAIEVTASVPQLVGFAPGMIGLYKHSSGATIAAVSAAEIPPDIVSNQATCYDAIAYSAMSSPGTAQINVNNTSGINPMNCGGTQTGYPGNMYNYPSDTGLGLLLAGINSLTSPIVGTAHFQPFYMTICLTNACQAQPGLDDFAANFGKLFDFVGVTLPCYGGSTINAQLTSSASRNNTYYTYALGPEVTCNNTTCSMTSGTYCGSVIMPPNATIDFIPGGIFGSGISNNLFTQLGNAFGAMLGDSNYVFVNSNLVLQSSDTVQGYSFNGSDMNVSGANLSENVGTSGNGANASFFFYGSDPGALVVETQAELDVHNMSSGTITFTSSSAFSTSTQAGIVTQFSTPTENAAMLELANNPTSLFSSLISALTNIASSTIGQYGPVGSLVNAIASDNYSLNYLMSAGQCRDGETTCTICLSGEYGCTAADPLNPSGAAALKPASLVMLNTAHQYGSGLLGFVNGLLGGIFNWLFGQSLDGYVVYSEKQVSTALNIQNGAPVSWLQSQSSNSQIGARVENCGFLSLNCFFLAQPSITTSALSSAGLASNSVGETASGTGPLSVSYSGNYGPADGSGGDYSGASATCTALDTPSVTACGSNLLPPTSDPGEAQLTRGNIYGIGYAGVLTPQMGELGGPLANSSDGTNTVASGFSSTSPGPLGNTMLDTLSAWGPSGSSVSIVTSSTPITTTTSTGTGAATLTLPALIN